MTEWTCPLCGSTEYAKITGDYGILKHYECKGCSVMFSNPAKFRGDSVVGLCNEKAHTIPKSAIPMTTVVAGNEAEFQATGA